MSHLNILKKIDTNTSQSHRKSYEGHSTWFIVYFIRPTITLHPGEII